MITYQQCTKQAYSWLILIIGLLCTLFLTGCAQKINVIEIHERYRNINAQVPEGRLFSDPSDAAVKGFLGGLTPQGLVIGGPLVTGFGATLHTLSPCINATEKVDQPLPKLQAIIRASDPGYFSSQLRPKVIEQQRLEHAKRFNTGGLPYGNDSKDIILVIDSLMVKLDGYTGWDMSCRPQLRATATWHIIEKNAPETQYRRYTSCEGKSHKIDFAAWYENTGAASEEVTGLLSQLAQSVATEVTSGYLVNKCDR